MTLEFHRLDASVLSLRAHSRGIAHNDHFVEFYDDDSSLVDSVQRFISMGIKKGEPAVVVADADHRLAFEDALSRSIDLARAREQELYVAADAQETISMFFEDGLPIPEKFNEVIGGMIAKAAAGGKKVRVFGEMVALLWAEGNAIGALKLEDLWNQLSESHAFRLFCAYPTRSFGGKNLAPLSAVCAHHSHIITPATRPI